MESRIHQVMDNSGFLDLLMPNRVRTQQMRMVAWFLLFWSSAIGIYVASVIGFDLYVRAHWHMVDGAVIKFDEKSALLGSVRSRRPTYWEEFEVEFDPKEWGCNTDSNWAVPMRFQCTGQVRSPGSQSLDVARNWGYRHPAGSPAKFYYDPVSGRLRFAGESILNLYPWTAIVALALGYGISFFLLYTSRTRLKGLRTFPDESGNVPSAEKRTRDDDLVDLKLP